MPRAPVVAASNLQDTEALVGYKEQYDALVASVDLDAVMLQSYARNIFEKEMPAMETQARNKRPSADVAPSSPEKPDKSPKFASAGATTYNRKEGNHSIPPPTRMVVQLPLNVGQHERVAEIIAGMLRTEHQGKI
jgi:hypothetical protein